MHRTAWWELTQRLLQWNLLRYQEAQVQLVPEGLAPEWVADFGAFGEQQPPSLAAGLEDGAGATASTKVAEDGTVALAAPTAAPTAVAAVTAEAAATPALAATAQASTQEEPAQLRRQPSDRTTSSGGRQPAVADSTSVVSADIGAANGSGSTRAAVPVPRPQPDTTPLSEGRSQAQPTSLEETNAAAEAVVHIEEVVATAEAAPASTIAAEAGRLPPPPAPDEDHEAGSAAAAARVATPQPGGRIARARRRAACFLCSKIRVRE